MNDIIAIMTDFGPGDYFAGLLKASIKKKCPGADIIDVTHGIARYSVTNAQYILGACLGWFPRGTVFLAVVDPGVGSERRALIAEGPDYRFVLPDSGIISPAAADATRYYEIDAAAFPGASATFHGRDIFAPVAAGLSSGASPEDFGREIDDPVIKKFPDYRYSAGSIECIIQHVDGFGNAITSVPNKEIDLTEAGSYTVGGLFTASACRTYSDLKKGRPGLLEGSSGFMELSMNMESISAAYGLKIDDRISIIKA